MKTPRIRFGDRVTTRAHVVNSTTVLQLTTDLSKAAHRKRPTCAAYLGIPSFDSTRPWHGLYLAAMAWHVLAPLAPSSTVRREGTPPPPPPPHKGDVRFWPLAHRLHLHLHLAPPPHDRQPPRGEAGRNGGGGADPGVGAAAAGERAGGGARRRLRLGVRRSDHAHVPRQHPRARNVPRHLHLR
jgi:hypothetical protein